MYFLVGNFMICRCLWLVGGWICPKRGFLYILNNFFILKKSLENGQKWTFFFIGENFLFWKTIFFETAQNRLFCWIFFLNFRLWHDGEMVFPKRGFFRCLDEVLAGIKPVENGLKWRFFVWGRSKIFKFFRKRDFFLSLPRKKFTFIMGSSWRWTCEGPLLKFIRGNRARK